jgi:leucyl aminopeptidase
VAKLGLPLDVTGLIASAENMPGSRAYKPGDVITQLNGTTVEVINTDAEGRVVLGDALSYAVRKKPDAMVDLATLTGAATVAVGSHAVAMMANDDDLAERMEAAGRESGEWIWRLPLWKQYRRLLASDVADVKNAGSREAGTIAGGIFLEKFVDGIPWVHLDIAGTAWSDAAKGWRAKGGTGVGVALVTQFLSGFAGGPRPA